MWFLHGDRQKEFDDKAFNNTTLHNKSGVVSLYSNYLSWFEMRTDVLFFRNSSQHPGPPAEH